ncbi:MAG: hydrolase 2, exosortase A system-associated [Gammaproteobacteria bacterium]
MTAASQAPTPTQTPTRARAPRLEQLFLPTARGEILLTSWVPGDARPAHWLLVAPPFAEEMNKSRRMFALLGQAAARAGYGVLLVDLAGTGDSWGDFRDARYEQWLDDLRAAVRWVEAGGGQVRAILGLRFGALLAMEMARELPSLRRLLLWQPAQSGTDVLTQFLRLRTAAALTGGGEAGETLESLRTRLEQGEALEVAGYELPSELYSAVRRRQLAELLPPSPLVIDWFHLVRQDGVQLPVAIGAAAERLRVPGGTSRTHTVRGDAFWATAEIASCVELVELTVACLVA